MVKKFVVAAAVIALLSGCKSVIVRHDVPVHVVERHHVHQRPVAPAQQVIVRQHVHVEQTYSPPPPVMQRPPLPPIIIRPILPPPHAGRPDVPDHPPPRVVRPVVPPPHAGKPDAPDHPPPRVRRPVAPPPHAAKPDVPPPMTRPVVPPPHRQKVQPLPRETARAPVPHAPWPGNPAQ
jgi:hypothetical protein